MKPNGSSQRRGHHQNHEAWKTACAIRSLLGEAGFPVLVTYREKAEKRKRLPWIHIQGFKSEPAQSREIARKLGSPKAEDPFVVSVAGKGCFVCSPFPGCKGKRFFGKIAVVTGGAQGFGLGIAEYLYQNGAAVVIADLNRKVADNAAKEIAAAKNDNRILAISADVSKDESVERLFNRVALRLGGLDLLVSNAGILKAGGLDELSTEDFQMVTRVNYEGFFLCAKHASRIMKVQNRHRPEGYCDIIQINSKSGLSGSNRNFAYAGGKFGGIGLTQSFALELIEHRIKVNAICPGNLFDGPLWSDSKRGLFVQYLRAGKVPGARSIEDVRAFYESKVPMKRGCRIEDVCRAIGYVVEQEYETGQAVPVTGGQVMLA